TTSDNLKAGRAYEITDKESEAFLKAYETYLDPINSYELLAAAWAVASGRAEAADFPQFNVKVLEELAPSAEANRKALGCALETKRREHLERKRQRKVPVITPEFIDDTPYFQEKLREFIIKAKLQLMTGAGVILLSGPPSTGKSAFLKFAAAAMNREYFEHAADKWQTKNSLVTAIKFGENGPYTTPAGFTTAITTPHSLLNIEEIKEWPEALRKSLNPFFAGSDIFQAPDGTAYKIGENILLCAAANLGAIYRQDDEPFTADFWSRIEVVEFNYAPHATNRDYVSQLHSPPSSNFLTMRDLARDYFNLRSAPTSARERAKFLARKFLEFLLLPKAEEQIKQDNLSHQLGRFFDSQAGTGGSTFGPEEAAKVALRRMKDFQGYSPKNFFDLYDHFVNGQSLRSQRLAKLQSTDVKKYEHLYILILTLYYLEGALRNLREQFYSSAGQSEIEGTNREFINAVYLLEMVGA
ncbi:MAG: AAA family ATPase, partial [Bacteroidota bacterium]